MVVKFVDRRLLPNRGSARFSWDVPGWWGWLLGSTLGCCGFSLLFTCRRHHPPTQCPFFDGGWYRQIQCRAIPTWKLDCKESRLPRRKYEVRRCKILSSLKGDVLLARRAWRSLQQHSGFRSWPTEPSPQELFTCPPSIWFLGERSHNSTHPRTHTTPFHDPVSSSPLVFEAICGLPLWWSTTIFIIHHYNKTHSRW